MVISSRFHAEVPKCSVQQWIFGSPSGPLPDKRAFMDADAPEKNYLTFHHVRLLAKQFAAGLIHHGLKPGDRVLMFSANHLYFPPMTLGIWMAGGIFTGANPSYTARELAHQIKDSEASIVIAATDSMKTALEAAKIAKLSGDRIFEFDGVLDSSRSKSQKWTDLLATLEEGEAFKWIEPSDPESTTCSLNYSSGTVRKNKHEPSPPPSGAVNMLTMICRRE